MNTSKTIDEAINEFCDYSYLLKENKELNEINLKDLSAKVTNMLSYAKEKTGNVIGDAALSIYIQTANKINATIQKLQSTEKDKKNALILRILAKIVNHFIKNPKLAFYEVRLGLLTLSLIASALAGFQYYHNPASFDSIFKHLGIDVAGPHIQSNQEIFDNMEKLQDLAAKNDADLGNKINQQVAQMGIDIHNPQYLQAGSYHSFNSDHTSPVAPTDLMHDPAYHDFQMAMQKVEQVCGEDNARRIENLVKLHRLLEEQEFKGVEVSSHVISKSISIEGNVSNYNSRTLFSNFKMIHNGVVLADLKNFSINDEKDSAIYQRFDGLYADIGHRIDQLTKGLDDTTKEHVFKGMQKFSSWQMTGRDWNKKNESYARLMYLAGIITEENILQKAKNVITKFTTPAKGFLENFKKKFSENLNKLIGSYTKMFLEKENLEKISDGKTHKFTIKNGKLVIH